MSRKLAPVDGFPGLGVHSNRSPSFSILTMVTGVQLYQGVKALYFAVKALYFAIWAAWRGLFRLRGPPVYGLQHQRNHTLTDPSSSAA